MSGFKSTQRSYAQCRQWEMDFWEHVTEVVYSEGMSPMDARRFFRQVSNALARISPVDQYERRG